MSVTFTMDISNAKSTNMYGMNNIIKEVKFILTGTDGVNTMKNFLIFAQVPKKFRANF